MLFEINKNNIIFKFKYYEDNVDNVILFFYLCSRH